MKIKYLFIAALMVAIGCSAPSTEQDSSNDGVSKTDEPVKPASKWESQESVDRMTGDTSVSMGLLSDEEIVFNTAGIESSSDLRLIVRKKKGKEEVILSMTEEFVSGFMISIGDQAISAKFDDNKPVKFKYVGTNDGSMDVIFLQNSEKFIKMLKNSNKLLIEATYIGDGNKIADFTTTGFEW